MKRLNISLNPGGWIGALLALAVGIFAILSWALHSERQEAVYMTSKFMVLGMAVCAGFGNYLWTNLVVKPNTSDASVTAE
jgi:hypothetical protein